MAKDYITFTIGPKKDIALIAHDNEKPKLIEWCQEHYSILKHHNTDDYRPDRAYRKRL